MEAAAEMTQASEDKMCEMLELKLKSIRKV